MDFLAVRRHARQSFDLYRSACAPDLPRAATALDFAALKITRIPGHDLPPDVTARWIGLQAVSPEIEGPFFHPAYVEISSRARGRAEVAIIEDDEGGMTLLPYCDGALIAESARLRGPFVPLGVAPEAGSSATFAAPNRVPAPQVNAYVEPGR